MPDFELIPDSQIVQIGYHALCTDSFTPLNLLSIPLPAFLVLFEPIQVGSISKISKVP